MGNETIRATGRFSSLEVDAFFREAAASVGIPIDEVRRATSLPIEFFYAALDLMVEKAVALETHQCGVLVDLGNAEVRAIVGRFHQQTRMTEVPGMLMRGAKPGAEVTAQELRDIQAVLRDRGEAIRARLATNARQTADEAGR